MLQFLTKPVFIYGVIFVLFLSSIGLSYYFGSRSGAVQIIEQEAKEFQDTTDKVNQGLNEVRKANPSRDAGVSLERLRERQSGK